MAKRIWLGLALFSNDCSAFLMPRWGEATHTRPDSVGWPAHVAATEYSRLKSKIAAAAPATAATTAASSSSAASDKSPPTKTFDRWLEVESWRQPALRDLQVLASASFKPERLARLHYQSTS
jgi:hypothetical protein